MFNDTDRTVFVARDDSGTITGIWTVRQHAEQEEILEDDAGVVAFRERQVAATTPSPIAQLAAILADKDVITAEQAASFNQEST